jgi:hypothetical protein
MTNTLRNSAIALALLGGAALLPVPASAGSIHDNGNFGGSWNRIGPSHSYRHHYGYRNYGYRNYGYRSYGYAAPRYYAPRYGYAPAYSYGAPYSYGYYGPGIGFAAPGFSVGIGVY